MNKTPSNIAMQCDVIMGAHMQHQYPVWHHNGSHYQLWDLHRIRAMEIMWKQRLWYDNKSHTQQHLNAVIDMVKEMMVPGRRIFHHIKNWTTLLGIPSCAMHGLSKVSSYLKLVAQHNIVVDKDLIDITWMSIDVIIQERYTLNFHLTHHVLFQAMAQTL